MRVVENCLRRFAELVMTVQAVIQDSEAGFPIEAGKHLTYVQVITLRTADAIRPAKATPKKPRISLCADRPEERLQGVGERSHYASKGFLLSFVRRLRSSGKRIGGVDTTGATIASIFSAGSVS